MWMCPAEFRYRPGERGVRLATWVDVGGYRLAADVTSGAQPVTVFISGRGDDRTVWSQVLPLLRTRTSTVVYDRAGIGESDPRPARTPQPYSVLADELVALLHGVPLTGPFVLVAHSMGAVIACSLAARHPTLVAGLVLIDGSVDEVALWPGITSRDGQSPAATHLDYKTGAAELASTPDPAVPAVVMTRTPGRPWPGAPAAQDVDRRWTRHQRQIADRLDAALLVADNSDHYLHHDASELVAWAIDATINAVLSGGAHVSLDSQQVMALGGSLARSPCGRTSTPASERPDRRT